MVQALKLQSSDGFVRVQSSRSKKANQRNKAEALLRKRGCMLGQEGRLELAEEAVELYR